MIEQGSEEWFALRCGLATASRFSSIISGLGKMSASMDGYAAELAADRFAGRALDKWEGNAATERGNELEDQARKYYELFNGWDVNEIAFQKHPTLDAGCSPDGLVSYDGLVEIKNQLPKGHVQTLSYYSRNKACPPDYIPQVQGQLWIMERAWCDLFFHHPDLPKLCIRIERDEKYIESLIRGVELCLEKRDDYLSIMRGML